MLGLSVLALCLTIAVWHDLRRFRVPNAVLISGAVFALVFHSVLPFSTAWNPVFPTGIGISMSLVGMAAGLTVLLPFYWVRALGAGDVKTMALVGAFLGPVSAVAVAVLSFTVGAMLALLYAAHGGVLRRAISNVRLIVCGLLPGHALAGAAFRFNPQTQAAAKVPYTVAIATGTCIWVGLACYR